VKDARTRIREISAAKLTALRKAPIVVYCQGGGRSAVAADVLGKMGYTDVSSLGWRPGGL
jgi:rhodanese-related sulfurtransferase